MRGYKKYFFSIISTLCLLCFCGCSTQIKQDVKQIRIAHDNGIQTPIHKAFLHFEKLVEEKSDHQIDVILFPAAQMGSVIDTYEQVRRGDVEMSATTTSNLVSSIPEFSIWESFYMFDDADHAKRVLEGPAGIEMMEPLERMNLKGIGYMALGFRNFSNSKRPIIEAKDVKGLKMRGYNPLQIAAWSAVGAAPTSVSWNELFTSLQQKLIDGQECAINSFYLEKFYEAQKYLSLTKHIFTNFLWFANAEFIESLSKEEYDIIMESAKEAIDYNWQLVSEIEQDTLKLLEESGIEINELDQDARREMGEKMNHAIKDEIVKMCGEEVYNSVFEEIEKARQN